MHKKVALLLLLGASAATAHAQAWDPTERLHTRPIPPRAARPQPQQAQPQQVQPPLAQPPVAAPSRFAPPPYQQSQPAYQPSSPAYAQPAPVYAQPAPVYQPPGAAYLQPAYAGSIAADIERWNALRQTDALPFSAYASFLIGHRGWPSESALRHSAEAKAGQADAYPADVARFFAAYPPQTAAGHAAYAFALLTTGMPNEAREEARRAWTGGALPIDVEQRVIASFGSAFGPADHDQRIDVLLGAGDIQAAQRALSWSSPARRGLYQARLALQTRAPDAAAQVAALDDSARRDPGLVFDQALWLRNTNQVAASRQALAVRGPFDRPVANPARYLDTALALARGAANDGNWSQAYGIAARLGDLYPAGTDVSDRPYGERDDYTSLTWLGGNAALFHLGRPADAARLFEQYGRAARSPQTRAKGFYWAARAATAAGNGAQASAWLEQAAVSPDQFYGQLALERLGRTPLPPSPSPPIDAAERAAFAARPLAQAVRYLGSVGRRADQTTFLRALAAQLQNHRERELAGDLGRSIGRLDLGVWAAREARTGGASFYAAAAFPQVTIPAAYSSNWALAHGIIRQESSFERTAVSNAGARGLMQLMPGTARQTASRVGVGYEGSRLTEDPQYNVLLGSYYLSELLDEWGGNAVLVAAAYNAGSGNVRRWIAANGDPRMPGVDVVRWIEEIPFQETRNYVQRVLENAVVYDLMNPNRAGAAPRNRISAFLGQGRPG